jgi:hypothetical protein
VVTKLLNDGHTYREVQMVTKHKDPKTIMKYDHARENLDMSPVNSLSYLVDVCAPNARLKFSAPSG